MENSSNTFQQISEIYHIINSYKEGKLWDINHSPIQSNNKSLRVEMELRRAPYKTTEHFMS